MTAPDQYGPDSRYAWLRLCVTLTLMTLGASGMYIVSVGLPAIQAEFGVDRSDASTPYTALMIGFGVGGVLMGKLADRYGVSVPTGIGAVGLGLGFIAAGLSPSLAWVVAAHGLMIGMLGIASTFSPLVADTTLWFDKRRGLAVAICASGNYLGGTFWPPIVQHFIETVGWRQTFIGVGIFCLLTMLPLSFLLRRRAPALSAVSTSSSPSMLETDASRFARPMGLSPNGLFALLCLAGVTCCVAMAMPQVHIVAYCTDLGYGAARGAQMLALMLGFGIVSRLASGLIADRIGGVRTFLLGSILQCTALFAFLPSDGLASLYVASILFGLFQGGIVPSYALIVREYFAPEKVAMTVSVVISSTLLGMALGGWLSGLVFDLTGSYRAAFINGIAWNLANVAIAAYLVWRAGGGRGRSSRGRVSPAPTPA